MNKEKKKAKKQWIKSMKKNHPDFNPKLWGKKSDYRINNPQGNLK